MSAINAVQSLMRTGTAAGNGTPSHEALDDVHVTIAQLAARICSAPCASLTVHESGTVWCSSQAVLGTEAAPEADPFIAYALRTDGPFEVPDTSVDFRFAERTVHGYGVRSCAGSTLRSGDGHAVTLAVYGALAGRITEERRSMLELLTRQAVAHSALRAQATALALLAEQRDTGSTSIVNLAHAQLASAAGDLLRAEALFHNTFDQAPIGIAYSDRDGRIFRCNPAVGHLLRFDAEELAGVSSGSLTHPDDVEIMLRELTRLWNGEVQFVDIEKRYGRKDGSYVWVRATTALVRDASGNPECAVEFLRDISQRKDLAAELLQQQTLLEAVITDLPMALVACDTSGRITHHNRAALELHGVPQIDAAAAGAATYLADGITPVGPEERPLARALRGETISNLELVVVPPDASPRTTLSSARRLVDPGGSLLGAVAVVQDTTERKKSELELERVHKELVAASRQAGMAEVATNVLHNVGNILNSVNISASLVAERVKQSKASVIASVAALLLEQGSNLGAFLTTDPRGKAIPQFLATLGGQLAADRQKTLEELAELRENVEHIKETVAMQQSYAKLCGVTESVSVHELVEDSLRLNAGAFARHGVTLRREFGEVPAILVDKHKVLQILVNLVRNAKYACDESGKVDKLLTLRIEQAPAGVRISVIDNGVGIAPENMSRLFTHGFTTRQSGHGFGLHSGALAAQDLGGTLHAESAGLGHGASFILELPLQPPDVPHV
jgi:PAS domain S-box-containing protein